MPRRTIPIPLTARQRQIIAQALVVYFVEGEWSRNINVAGIEIPFTEERVRAIQDIEKLLGFYGLPEDAGATSGLFDEELDQPVDLELQQQERWNAYRKEANDAAAR